MTNNVRYRRYRERAILGMGLVMFRFATEIRPDHLWPIYGVAIFGALLAEVVCMAIQDRRDMLKLKKAFEESAKMPAKFMILPEDKS